jgi:hypothetical protein
MVTSVDSARFRAVRRSFNAYLASSYSLITPVEKAAMPAYE